MKHHEKNTMSWNQFTRQYSLQKTLRFALLPQGKTVEHIKTKNLIDSQWQGSKSKLSGKDAELAENYKIVKKLFRKMDQLFIDEALAKENVKKNFSKDELSQFEKYFKKYTEYVGENKKQNSDKNAKEVSKEKITSEFDTFKKTFSASLKKCFDSVAIDWAEKYNTNADRLTSNEKESEKKKAKKKQRFTNARVEILYKKNEDALALLQWKIETGEITHSGYNMQQLLNVTSAFKNFSSYFSGFNLNRANVYETSSTKLKKTSIAHRLFEENLEFYINNIFRWRVVQKNLQDKKNREVLKSKKFDADAELKKIESKFGKLDDFLAPANYVSFFSQEGIDRYNQMLGGDPADVGKQKERGLNEVINLTRQQLNSDAKHFPTMDILYKQILSLNDKKFIDIFESDTALLNAIADYKNDIGKKNLITKIQNEFKRLSNEFKENPDLKEEYYLSAESIREVSKKISGNFNKIHSLWYEHVDSLKQENGKSLNKKDKEKLQNQECLSFSEIENFVQKAINDDGDSFKEEWRKEFSIESYIKSMLYDLIVERNFSGEKNDNSKSVEKKSEQNSFAIQEVLTRKILDKTLETNVIENKKELTQEIKFYLDAHADLYRFLKSFQIKLKQLAPHQREATSGTFRSNLSSLMQEFDPLELYNKARNYLTKKDYSLDKIKLNFENATLAAGWDKNKETDNSAVLFKKDGLFYLGVMDKEFKKSFLFNDSKKIKEELEKKKKIFLNAEKKSDKEKLQILRDDIELLQILLEGDKKNTYEKMVYKLFPDPGKMIPKCSMQVKAVKTHFTKSDKAYIHDGKQYIKPLSINKTIFNLNNMVFDEDTNKFSLKSKDDKRPKKFQKDYLDISKDVKGYEEALHNWIDFCKDFLNSYASTSFYDYSVLKPTKEYASCDEFYKDVKTITYKVSFEKIPVAYINMLVEKGRLYFFQIYNKDFSSYSKGKKNLHTLYWENAFTEENLQDVIIKLNGEAELFYRPVSMQKKFVHAEGSILKHKHFKNDWENLGFPISKIIHFRKDLENLLNSKKITINQNNQIFYQEKIIGKIVEKEKEIIKDRRFTQEQYLFHCPITLNYKESDPFFFNNIVNDVLAQNKKQCIIGIDRGEKHLLYLSVIDGDGNMIHQESLNVIDDASNNGQKKLETEKYSTDYHELLDTKEKERDAARKSWDTIENIKELKSGYLSQVVHKLSMMIIEHNAILVLEDLNSGFKRGRFKVEKQVYQKFERALIEKLNYLVLKDRKEDEAGGVLNAFQLADQFTSFEKLGKQSGILFYTEAKYTSKTDPVSGYMKNVYHRYEPQKTKNFFQKFDGITFDGEHFYFTYDLKKLFNEPKDGFPHKTVWTVCSCVERSQYNPKSKQHDKPEVVSEKLIKLFTEFKIPLEKNQDIKPLLANAEEEFTKKFFIQFNSILDMRVIDDTKEKGSRENDYILSPVLPYFDSRKANENLPQNGDANGAYNIARKGIIVLKKNRLRKQVESLFEEGGKNKKLAEAEIVKIKDRKSLTTIFEEWLLWMELDSAQPLFEKNKFSPRGKEFVNFIGDLSVSKKEWENFCQRSRYVEEQKKKYQS